VVSHDDITENLLPTAKSHHYLKNLTLIGRPLKKRGGDDDPLMEKSIRVRRKG
jgi:hypothetical protein